MHDRPIVVRFPFKSLGVPLVLHISGAPFSAEVSGRENGGYIDARQMEGDMSLIRHDGEKGIGWIRAGAEGHHGKHLRDLEDAQLELIDLARGLLALAHTTCIASRAGSFCNAGSGEQKPYACRIHTH